MKTILLSACTFAAASVAVLPASAAVSLGAGVGVSHTFNSNTAPASADLAAPQQGDAANPEGMGMVVDSARTPYTLDINVFYAFRAVPHSKYATDMAGIEAELAYAFTPNHAITFTLSFGSGGDDRVNYVNTGNGYWPTSADFERSDFQAMVGYRYTCHLTKRTSLSFGAKCGLDVQRLSYDDIWRYGGWGWDYYYRDDYGKTRCGFAYALAATIQTRLTEHTMLQIGYQFRGATTDPSAPDVVPGGPSQEAHTIRWHEVHVGVRIQF